jgi:hypothetical protein
MMRMQIQLTAEQRRQLGRWARQRGLSLSEAVRRCVAGHLAQEQSRPSREELVRSALAVVGKYADPAGSSRVALEHDERLVEAYSR